MGIDDSLKNVAKGAGILFIGMAIGNILGLIEQILYGRILGPENYGLFNLGLTLIMLLIPFTTFGLPSALLQFIPHNLAINRNEKVVGALKFSFTIFLIASIFMSLTLFFLSNLIAITIFHNGGLENVIKIFSIALPFVTIYLCSMNVTQAFKEAKYPAIFNNVLLKATEIVIFCIVAFLFGYKLGGALLGYLMGAIIVFIAYAYVIWEKILPSLHYEKIDTKIKKELFSIGLPLFFTGFTYLFMQYTDKILLGIYMTATDVGIFTAAVSIASLTLFILPSFEYIFLPTVAEFYGKKEFDNISKLFKAVSKWVFLLILPVVIYLIFYSQDVILLIYGSNYQSGTLSLIILSLGIAMNGLTGMTGNVLVGIRKTNYNLFSEISGAVSNVLLNILLIPIFGIVGAAIGTSISITVKNIVSLLFVYKEIKIHPYDLSYLKIAVLTITIMVFISFIIGKILGGLYSFLIAIPFFIIIYTFILYKFDFLTEYDKSLIKNILYKFGIKL